MVPHTFPTTTLSPYQFAFAQFLSWSDQPIYVLEKDNDLDIATLARRNAADILKVLNRGMAGHACPCQLCMCWPLTVEVLCLLTRLFKMTDSSHLAC